ncbi:uncharacterized protein [Halyomorpha halys]|uniref:uncharacterized protein n=1 Tax=Halyomorpha halys TaxID=286706 RepID=UPI0034D22595
MIKNLRYTAEMVAINKSLNVFHPTKQKLVICTDSLSVLLSLRNIFSTNPLNQNILLITVCHQKRYFRVLRLGPYGIAGNELVDRAAKVAIGEGIPYRKVPVNDFIALIKHKIKLKWRQMWENVSNNKLREIRRDVSPWISSTRDVRKEEVILTRLRIGHTRLSHGYLMARDPPRLCQACRKKLTVKHILTECRAYNTLKCLYHIPDDLYSILQDNKHTIDRLFKFLHQGQKASRQ